MPKHATKAARGKSARRRGRSYERRVRERCLLASVPCEMVPMSGGLEGFKGDIKIDGDPFECKYLAGANKTIRRHLEGVRGVIYGASNKEDLVVLRLKDYLPEKARLVVEEGIDGVLGGGPDEGEEDE